VATALTTVHAESAASMIGHITFDRNLAGKRSAGKPPATFDEAGTGDVAWLRCSGTRRRKSESTENTNFNLHRRASPRPYLRGPGVRLLGLLTYGHPPDGPRFARKQSVGTAS
jgi:hypothetical protein